MVLKAKANESPNVANSPIPSLFPERFPPTKGSSPLAICACWYRGMRKYFSGCELANGSSENPASISPVL